jgi:hypothetical protein
MVKRRRGQPRQAAEGNALVAAVAGHSVQVAPGMKPGRRSDLPGCPGRIAGGRCDSEIFKVPLNPGLTLM